MNVKVVRQFVDEKTRPDALGAPKTSKISISRPFVVGALTLLPGPTQ